MQLLDAERQECGITTGELAERAGLPEVELEAIFAGERDATVRELAGLLTGLGRELQARDIKPRGMGM